ncbi:hypothetical protein [Virgibacillus oceani]|uniref:hypothetical protein n=1 Tax=Virgibacillus oceani TaxID=1479511 RepID=UPI00166BC045|nr:hypothetical protein [Virgibacillus oceani]
MGIAEAYPYLPARGFGSWSHNSFKDFAILTIIHTTLTVKEAVPYGIASFTYQS